MKQMVGACVPNPIPSSFEVGVVIYTCTSALFSAIICKEKKESLRARGCISTRDTCSAISRVSPPSQVPTAVREGMQFCVASLLIGDGLVRVLVQS